LEDQGDYKGAETAWNQAIKLEPKAAVFYSYNLAIRQNYGHYLCENHSYNNAITEFQEILKMDSDWNIARPCLYISLYNVGRKDEAAQVLAEYRNWNQTHGVPDDSDQIEVRQPRIDDPRGRTRL